MTSDEKSEFFNIKERDALKHAFCALYKMLIVFDISPSLCFPLPKRYPLSDEQIDAIIASNVTITDPHLLGAVYMAIREVEAAHGIGGEE